MQTPRNWSRWSNPELDKIIEQIRAIAFDDPKGIELGQEYVKLAVQEMPVIPLMAYNVFTMMDHDLLDRLSDSGRPLHQPGSELGQLALHDGQAEADPGASSAGLAALSPEYDQ